MGAVTFIDKNGQQQEIQLNDLSLYREAMAKGVSFRQLVNQKYPTQAGMPDTFMQMCRSAGLRFRKDEVTGIPAANLMDVLEPQSANGSFVDSSGISPSRYLFPVAVLEVMESALQGEQNEATAAMESIVGYNQTISTSKFEQPVVDYTQTQGPESSQFSRIAQNAAPNIMLSLKASDVTRKVGTTSIGLEISREAMMGTTLDLVALTMMRFLKIANYNEWVTQIGLLLSGDPDATVTTFSAGTSALSSVTAASYDATIVANGVLTQAAWLKYLYNKSLKMTKTHIICDFATMLAIDNRLGRPTNFHNNTIDRVDVPFKVIYPVMQDVVNIIVMPSGTFSANTIMGLDATSPAVGKVVSTFAEYSAIEDVVMRKSTTLRIDRGWLAWRMWDDAFDVMTLTV